MNTIGERLKQIIDKKKINQAELARLLNLSPGYISEVLKNKKVPGGEVIASLQEKLNVHVFR